MVCWEVLNRGSEPDLVWSGVCRCAFERGAEDPRCEFYKNAYFSLCPPDWVSHLSCPGWQGQDKTAAQRVDAAMTDEQAMRASIHRADSSLCCCCRLRSGRSCASRASGLASIDVQLEAW